MFFSSLGTPNFIAGANANLYGYHYTLCIPDTGRCIFAMLGVPSRVRCLQHSKSANYALHCYQSKSSLVCKYEDNFSTEWKIFSMK